jgi:hypothetical protein
MGDQHDGRPILTQDGTTQKNWDKHPYLERDRTHNPSVRAVEIHTLNRTVTDRRLSFFDVAVCNCKLFTLRVGVPYY